MDLLSPLLFIFVIATPSATEKQLAEFSRFATAHEEEVAVVDVFGAESLGRVVAATETAVTLSTNAGTRTFYRADLLKADRLRDSTNDGLARGMAVGAVGGLAGATQGRMTVLGFAGGVAVSGLIGYLLDLSSPEREPLYKRP
jgi:hypothetical protein